MTSAFYTLGTGRAMVIFAMTVSITKFRAGVVPRVAFRAGCASAVIAATSALIFTGGSNHAGTNIER